MSILNDYFFKGPAITLNSGREINIQSIEQYLAYSHILEGIPYGQQYKGMVDSQLKNTQDKYPNHKVLLLEPRIRELPLPNDELARIQNYGRINDVPPRTDLNDGEVDTSSLENIINAGIRNREIVSIGAVCCLATFRSAPINKDVGVYSELVMIWYQDGWAFPIESFVIEQIKTIDWEKHSADYNP